MRIKKVAVLMLAISLLLLIGGCAANEAKDTSWEKAKEKGVFVLGFDENFPPMGFIDENKEHVGFDIDLAREATKRAGLELKLQPIDWSAKEQELNSGNIDCIWNGLTMNPDREEAMGFTRPYLANKQVLVVRADSGITTPADLNGKAVALQAGSSAAEALDKATDFKATIKDGKPIELKENLTALMDLESGGVDAVLMDEIVARYYITTSGKALVVLDEAIASEKYGIAFRRGDYALRGKINKALDDMCNDGTMAEISKKWFGEDITVW